MDDPFCGNTAADLGNPAAVPLLASVPLNSVWLFASVSFGVLTYVSARLIANRRWPATRRAVCRWHGASWCPVWWP